MHHCLSWLICCLKLERMSTTCSKSVSLQWNKPQILHSKNHWARVTTALILVSLGSQYLLDTTCSFGWEIGQATIISGLVSAGCRITTCTKQMVFCCKRGKRYCFRLKPFIFPFWVQTFFCTLWKYSSEEGRADVHSDNGILSIDLVQGELGDILKFVLCSRSNKIIWWCLLALKIN